MVAITGSTQLKSCAMQQLREIRLYGFLGKRFGRVHHMAVASVGEAIRALRANFKDFEAALLAHEPGYRVWTGAENVGDKELSNPIGANEPIKIVPVVAGAKQQGVGQIILGVVLVIVAAIGSYYQVPGSSYLANIGFAMIVGGVIQMLSPPPRTDDPNKDTTRPSYLFSGATNTTAQGNPVPVGYGRLIVGSAVVSAGLSIEEMPITSSGGGGDDYIRA